jgi:hypothetical protein
MTALPTRKLEAWRYADLKAVEALWPPHPARLISVPAGASDSQLLRVDAGGIHDVRVELAPGARLQLVVVITSATYARVSVEAHLKAGADLDLGGILLGGGTTTVELVTDVRHQEPEAASRQRVRMVLDEQATGNFLGRIAVARDAQLTDAATRDEPGNASDAGGARPLACAGALLCRPRPDRPDLHLQGQGQGRRCLYRCLPAWRSRPRHVTCPLVKRAI